MKVLKVVALHLLCGIGGTISAESSERNFCFDGPISGVPWSLSSKKDCDARNGVLISEESCAEVVIKEGEAICTQFRINSEFRLALNQFKTLQPSAPVDAQREPQISKTQPNGPPNTAGVDDRPTPAKVNSVGVALLGHLASSVPSSVETRPRLNDAEVSRTWEEAIVVVPASLTSSGERFTGSVKALRQEKLKVKFDVPVVLWFHECGSIGAGSTNFFAMAREAGYVVIAPRSFVRTGRQIICGPNSYSKKSEIRKFREEEILYALQELRESSGVDYAKTVLAGFSEGAAAVRRFRAQKGEANGLIMLAPWCSDRMGERINSSKSIRALSIIGTKDPYITMTKTGHNCRTWGFQKPSGSFEFSHGHDVTELPEVSKIVIDHLIAWRQASSAPQASTESAGNSEDRRPDK